MSRLANSRPKGSALTRWRNADARRSAGLADEVAGPGDGRGRLAPFPGKGGGMGWSRCRQRAGSAGAGPDAKAHPPPGGCRSAAWATLFRRGPSVASRPREERGWVQVGEADRSPPLTELSVGGHPRGDEEALSIEAAQRHVRQALMARGGLLRVPQTSRRWLVQAAAPLTGDDGRPAQRVRARP